MKKFEQIFDPVYLAGGEREIGAKKNGWHDTWKEEKVFKFTWDYCAQCDVMFVRCPACGNNCCNAGFGKVTKDLKLCSNYNDPDSMMCPICNLAYQFQHESKERPPKPSKKECKRLKKKLDEAWDKLLG